jgi:hypothetical protein
VLETTAGIELAYAILQTAARPLRHVAGGAWVTIRDRLGNGCDRVMPAKGSGGNLHIGTERIRSPFFSRDHPTSRSSALAFCRVVSQKAAARMRLGCHTMFDAGAARRMMVDGQTRPADITDLELLAAHAGGAPLSWRCC